MKSWPLEKVNNLLTLEYGKSLPDKVREQGVVPVVGSNGIVGFHNEALITGPAIVVGRKGTAGRVNWIAEDCFPIDTTYWVKITYPEKLDLRYAYYALKKLKLEEKSAGTVPGLNRNDAYAKQIPLPPLKVQEDIVATLDSCLKLGKKREEADVEMVEFIRALFNQMFGDPAKNERGWEMKKLSSFAEFDKRTYDADINLPYVGLEDIEGGTGKLKNVHEHAEIKSKVFRFNENQILYAKLRPNLNKVILSNFSGQCSTELVPILMKDSITREWLFQILISNWFVQQAIKSIKGANLPRADLAALLNLEIAVPPPEFQKQFSDRVNEIRTIQEKQDLSRKMLVEMFEGLIDKML